MEFVQQKTGTIKHKSLAWKENTTRLFLINFCFVGIFALGCGIIPRFEIVVDGANIVHDNKNLDATGWAKIEPRRLEKVINHCENLGYENIIVFLKKGTYDVAKDKRNAEKVVGDPEFFDQLIEDGKLELIDSHSEDIFWLDFALLNSAYIITRDAFRDRKKKQEDGSEKITQRERSLFPNLDWDTIDSLLIRYHFLQDRFIAPSLPRKNDSSIGEVKVKQKPRKKTSWILSLFDKLFDFTPKSSQKTKPQRQTKKSKDMKKEPAAKKKKPPSKTKKSRDLKKEPAAKKKPRAEKKAKEPTPKPNKTPPEVELSETESSVKGDGDELPIEHFIMVILNILSDSEVTTLNILGDKIIEFQEENNWEPSSMTYFLNRHGLSKRLGLRRAMIKVMSDYVLISGEHPAYQMIITDKGKEYMKNSGK